jgi:hypothetical protein
MDIADMVSKEITSGAFAIFIVLETALAVLKMLVPGAVAVTLQEPPAKGRTAPLTIEQTVGVTLLKARVSLADEATKA